MTIPRRGTDFRHFAKDRSGVGFVERIARIECLYDCLEVRLSAAQRRACANVFVKRDARHGVVLFEQ